MRRLALAVFILLASAVVAHAATSPECAADPNCVCSDTLNTSAFTEYATAYWGSTNQGTKPCRIEGIVGAVLTRSGGGPLPGYWDPVTSGEAITNLPSGHTLTTVIRSASGTGGQFVGTNFTGTPARIEFQGYRYWSTGYDFTNDTGSCPNSSKWMQFGNPGPILDGPSGHMQMYSWTNSPIWTYSGGTSIGDCCWNGPGPIAGWSYDQHNNRGKWFRLSAVVRNPLGPGTRIEIYRRNITDNTTEVLMIDSSVPTTQSGVNPDWTSAQATTLKPGGRGAGDRVNELWIDTFRGGSCNGFVALSHISGWAWSTDAGQRAPAAAAVEGGGGGSTPPAAPTGLHFGALLLALGLSAVVVGRVAV